MTLSNNGVKIAFLAMCALNLKFVISYEADVVNSKVRSVMRVESAAVNKL